MPGRSAFFACFSESSRKMIWTSASRAAPRALVMSFTRFDHLLNRFRGKQGSNTASAARIRLEATRIR